MLTSRRHFPGAKPGPFDETEGNRHSIDRYRQELGSQICHGAPAPEEQGRLSIYTNGLGLETEIFLEQKRVIHQAARTGWKYLLRASSLLSSNLASRLCASEMTYLFLEMWIKSGLMGAGVLPVSSAPAHCSTYGGRTKGTIQSGSSKCKPWLHC